MLVEPGTLVMIVDDDVHARESVADLLAAEGYDVMPVSGGEAALVRIGLGAQPTVVILDLWLPGMGSVEFARRLRARLESRVAVLVLTAWPAWDRLDLKADALLAKPSDAASIVRAVDKLVASVSAKRHA